MIKLNEQFLVDIGLSSLGQDEKKDLLEHIYRELEVRVGTVLSDGMTNQQLDEFEAIVDKDDLKIKTWLASHSPNYYSDERYIELGRVTGLAADSLDLRAEYAANLWFRLYRPDYQKVVSEKLEELKKELIANRDKILS